MDSDLRSPQAKSWKNASRPHMIEWKKEIQDGEGRWRAFSSTLKNKWLISGHEQLRDHE